MTKNFVSAIRYIGPPVICQFNAKCSDRQTDDNRHAIS